jgi:SOS response regulatory protein OraA/RecX
VARPSTDQAISGLSESAEEDAVRAGYKRAEQLRGSGLDERTFESRLGLWLARRGFDWDTITRVVARLWAETAAS